TELTEGNASQWSSFAEDDAANRVTDDTTHVKVGTYSIHLHTASGFDTGVVYPAAGDAQWNLTGKDFLEFWVYSDDPSPSGFQGNQPIVELISPGGYFRYEPQDQQMPNHAWAQITIPLAGSAEWVRTATGSPTLANVGSIKIQ